MNFQHSQSTAPTAIWPHRAGSVDAFQQTVQPRRAHLSSVATVHEWECAADEHITGTETGVRFIFPLAGLLAYQTTSQMPLADANSVLVTRAGDWFRLHHPARAVGHISLTILPKDDILRELVCGASWPSLVEVRPASSAMKLIVHEIRRTPVDVFDTLRVDELVIALLSEALSDRKVRAARCSKLISRAKELLHSMPMDAVAGLDAIAAQLNVHSAYLTQEFTRSEGVPLSRYHRRLRLSRALAVLPDCADITELALELGFSSHSHFTFAFRREFGITPSEYREATWAKTECFLAA